MNPNPYYNPESLGLTQVAFLDMTVYDYSFDLRVVWLHEESGALYTAYDSGCSCPTPFEDFTSLDRLDRVPDDKSFDFLRSEAREYGSPTNDAHSFFDYTPDRSEVDNYIAALYDAEIKYQQRIAGR